MPTLEQKQLIAESRKAINIELQEELILLKLVQKEEKHKLQAKHQTQQENLILKKRKTIFITWKSSSLKSM